MSLIFLLLLSFLRSMYHSAFSLFHLQELSLILSVFIYPCQSISRPSLRPPSIYLSIHLSIHPSIYLSICQAYIPTLPLTLSFLLSHSVLSLASLSSPQHRPSLHLSLLYLILFIFLSPNLPLLSVFLYLHPSLLYINLSLFS